MKKISFLITVIFAPVLYTFLCYLFVEHFGLRPLGISIAFTIKDTLVLCFSGTVLFFYCDSKIYEAIERFEEKRKSQQLTKEMIEDLEATKDGSLDETVDEVAEIEIK
jgi:hypothetical protein